MSAKRGRNQSCRAPAGPFRLLFQSPSAFVQADASADRSCDPAFGAEVDLTDRGSRYRTRSAAAAS